MLFFYNNNLISSGHTLAKKNEGVPLSANVIEEALVCFIKEPPQAQTTLLELNQSTPWEKDNVDPRSFYCNLFFPPCRFFHSFHLKYFLSDPTFLGMLRFNKVPMASNIETGFVYMQTTIQ